MKLLWVLVAKSELLILPRLFVPYHSAHVGHCFGGNGSAQAGLRTAACRVDSFCPQGEKKPSVK